MTPTFNGIKLLEHEYLKDQRIKTLNMMLGQNNMPKYSEEELKSITRTQLLEEIKPLYEEALIDHPKEPKVYKKRGAKFRPCKNRHNALSKKCLVIKALCEGKSTLEEAMYRLGQDYWFSEVCTAKELKEAYETKQRPSTRNRRLDMELKDNEVEDLSGYIVAKGDYE